ncbi:MAG TPA: hypothetical protein VGG16_27850 [Streptosporangiaceae bacterium]|jgi:hypothetical protein
MGDRTEAPGLSEAEPAELYSARSCIAIVTRVGAMAGEIPAEVSGWLAGLAADIDAEIGRR